MTDAIAGWIVVGTAGICASKGLSALIAGRHAAAPSGHADRAQKWQWLVLAGLQMIIGVWFITGPSRHPAVQWWVTSGFGALAAWMLVTDFGPWLRSRLKGSSSREPT